MSSITITEGDSIQENLFESRSKIKSFYFRDPILDGTEFDSRVKIKSFSFSDPKLGGDEFDSRAKIKSATSRPDGKFNYNRDFFKK